MCALMCVCVCVRDVCVCIHTQCVSASVYTCLPLAETLRLGTTTHMVLHTHPKALGSPQPSPAWGHNGSVD